MYIKDLPELTPDLKRRLTINCNNHNYADVIAQYISSGKLKLGDLTGMNEDSRNRIMNKVQELTKDPEFERLYEEICKFDIQTENDENVFFAKADDFLGRYSTGFGYENQVEHVRNKKSKVEKKRSEREKNDKQEQDNREYEEFSNSSCTYEAIIKYIERHTLTSHFNELDDKAFAFVRRSPDSLLSKYVEDMTRIQQNCNCKSKHIDEAESWLTVRDSEIKEAAIFNVKDFLDKYPDSPFLEDADKRFKELKDSELLTMQTNPTFFSVERFKKLIERNIFTKSELIGLDLLTEGIWERLTMPTVQLQPLNQINEADLVCPSEPRHTDVFFFGIPNTGKTCALMGLLTARNVLIQNQLAGGGYSNGLRLYLNAGKVPQRTYGDFVTAINGEIKDGENPVRHINLIEMAGESFAFDLVEHPGNTPDIVSMGHGITQILSNGNDKIFFMIIDPTADNIQVSRAIYDDDGNVLRYNNVIVNQLLSLEGMLNMLRLSLNKDIMNHVNAIHFIVTKADTLTEKYGMEDIKAKYASARRIAETIIKEAPKGMNVYDDGNVNFYPFSLGKFYVGGLFEYDDTDANDLVEVIKNNSRATRDPNFWSKLRSVVNPRD